MMDKAKIFRLKAANVTVSLLLPLTAVLFIGFTLNYFWQMNFLAISIYAFAFSFSTSVLNRNIYYRIAVALLVFVISFLLTNLWPSVQVLFITLWATVLAHSFDFLKWGKFFWLIIFPVMGRLLIVWMFVLAMPNCCDFLDGELFDKSVTGLLIFTYSIIVVLLLFDLLIMIAKRLFAADEI